MKKIVLKWSMLCLIVAATFVFAGCIGGKSLKIRTGTKVIEADAYKNNKKIETVLMPDTVTEIGDEAFWNCDNLKSVTIPGSVKVIGKSAFSQCDQLESVVLSSGVIEIGEYAFDNCPNLKSIALPDTLQTIGPCAFRNTGLTSVVIPSGVRFIGNSAFEFSSLTSASIPASVTEMHQAFGSCRELTDVVLEDGLAAISDWCFSYCEKLSYVNIPDSVKTIGENVFKDTAMVSGAGEWLPMDAEGKEELFSRAEDKRDTEEKITESKSVKIMPLQYQIDWKDNVYMDLAGDLYCQMPKDLRTMNIDEADYFLIVDMSEEHSANYIGEAYDSVCCVYLYKKDGGISLLFLGAHSPTQQFAVLGPGVNKITGDKATGEEIWNCIGKMFN
ncbi:MAG: leucine-rich repeat domain-containing protein [Lachnospiraceae bacterium]|nr:leucine-rich repeat domain-containing protein [Lachnospiraceae bacterium]